MSIIRKALTAFAIIGASALLLFLVTGALDYFYVRYLVDGLESGLTEVEWANPYLGKAVIGALSAGLVWMYFRHFAILKKPSPAYYFVLSGGIGMTGLCGLNTIRAATGWNHYFDAYGQALRYYCITPDNKPHFFLKQRSNPWTSEPLKPVTPEVVHDIEARLASPFHSVEDPPDNDWFWPGDRYPRFTYSRHDDGTIHLFSALGYDSGTAQELQPATLPIKEEYQHQQELKREAAEAKQQADAKAAEDRMKRQREEQEAQAELARLREQERDADRQKQLVDELAKQRKLLADEQRAADRRRNDETARTQDRAAEPSGERAEMSQSQPPITYSQPGAQYYVNGQPPLQALIVAALTGRLGHRSGVNNVSSANSQSESGRSRSSGHDDHHAGHIAKQPSGTASCPPSPPQHQGPDQNVRTPAPPAAQLRPAPAPPQIPAQSLGQQQKAVR